MKPVRTHTFALGKYDITQFKGYIDGVCDLPNDNTKRLGMMIPDGDDLNTLDATLHEALHASGVPDKYLHDKDGYSKTEPIARFLWRLGWRKE